MGQHKGDIEIGKRAAEEVDRVFKSYAEAAKAICCERKAIFSWVHGTTPSGIMLARMHYCGCDVMYILTGNRNNSLLGKE